MALVTVRGTYKTPLQGEKLDAEFDAIATRLIDLEDSVLRDSTLSADLESQEIVIEVTVATDGDVQQAEAIGFDYIDRAVQLGSASNLIENTVRQAELVA